MKNKKWSDSLSVSLSSVIIKVLFVLFLASSIYAPFAIKTYGILFEGIAIPLAVTFYACAVFAFTALYGLGRLVKNIRLEQIFIPMNVGYLRLLSWCCYGVAAATGFFSLFIVSSGIDKSNDMGNGFLSWNFAFFVIAGAAAFFGLILRVLKNVFEEAVKLREESEYTI